MSRIELTDSGMDILVKLAEGNPGAVSAMAGFLKRHPADGIVHLCKLDDNQIYGPRIWLLWKNLCHFDAEQFDSLLLENRVYEMGNVLSQADAALRKEWDYPSARVR